MKLNLGAGGWEIEGYENWDLSNGHNAYPLEVEDNSVLEIRASHILEHLSHRITMDVLRDWVRALKPGGVLKVAVPDFDICVALYHDDDPKAEYYIMGGQTDENDFHKTIFNGKCLKGALEAVGLIEVEEWSDVKDCSSLPVSLNLMGRKPDAQERSEPEEAQQREDLPEEAQYKGPNNEDYSWLTEKAANRYSQFGEDGILEAVFEKIGTTNKHVIECGAGDPIQHSNSRKLIEEGWTATLIEADEWKWRRLWTEYEATPKVECLWQTIGADSTLNFIGLINEVPPEPDLLVLDVDGQEYYIWNSLIKTKPRVVLCEFDVNADPDFIPPLGGVGQAGSNAIIRLAIGKGYAPIGQIGCNLLFVRQGLEKLLNADPDPEGFDASRIGTEVRACLSSSRLMFADTIVSVFTSMVPLGIMLEINTGVFWGQALTKMMEGHIDDPGLKYYLTLDFDTLFTQKDVLTLYRLMEEHPEIDVLCSLQMRREGETPLLTMMSKAGKNLQEISTAEMDAEVMPINSAHFGLTMVRVDSLKKAKKPWFLAVPDDKGEWGPEHMDEDVYFWHNLKESGLRAYQANQVTIGHLQLMATWPSQHLTPIHQYISEWYDNGKPKDAR